MKKMILLLIFLSVLLVGCKPKGCGEGESLVDGVCVILLPDEQIIHDALLSTKEGNYQVEITLTAEIVHHITLRIDGDKTHYKYGLEEEYYQLLGDKTIIYTKNGDSFIRTEKASEKNAVYRFISALEYYHFEKGRRFYDLLEEGYLIINKFLETAFPGASASEFQMLLKEDNTLDYFSLTFVQNGYSYQMLLKYSDFGNVVVTLP